jgi:hypothetical protein
VGENISLAELDQAELSVVGVSSVVFQAVQTGTEEAQGLVQVLVVVGAGVATTELDRATQDTADQGGRGINAKVFGCDVVFQA